MPDVEIGGSQSECVHCNGPATHRHALTDEFLCCGHASVDIDAKPIRDDHECVDFYTIRPCNRDFECEHRDSEDGEIVPCHEPAHWDLTVCKFPGDPFDPDTPGAPTGGHYCDQHFAQRMREYEFELLDERGYWQVTGGR